MESSQNYHLWSIDYCIWKLMEIILFHGLVLLNQYLMTVVFSNIWHTQKFISHKWLIESTIKLRLTDQFKQNWHSTLQISPKALSYRLFKSEFRIEKYLDILNDKNRFTLCRFKTSNHRLPIEVGRWANVERHNRLCQLC